MCSVQCVCVYVVYVVYVRTGGREGGKEDGGVQEKQEPNLGC